MVSRRAVHLRNQLAVALGAALVGDQADHLDIIPEFGKPLDHRRRGLCHALDIHDDGDRHMPKNRAARSALDGSPSNMPIAPSIEDQVGHLCRAMESVLAPGFTSHPQVDLFNRLSRRLFEDLRVKVIGPSLEYPNHLSLAAQHARHCAAQMVVLPCPEAGALRNNAGQLTLSIRIRFPAGL